jgi:prepilin-type N-terminal cleavage/methylation domain-containing protein
MDQDQKRLSSARRSGFTLIEVLIAVVILSTGIVMVLRAFDTALVALHDSRDTVRAALITRNRLADIRLAAAAGDAELAALGGRFIADDDYRGRIQIEAEREGLPAGTGDAGALHRVTLTVWHEETGFLHTIVTYVWTPPEPDAEEEGGHNGRQPRTR